tara:strand:- start:447 stop:650 length:204 start_codon:yes stop_codon:yes gene_type:complete
MFLLFKALLAYKGLALCEAPDSKYSNCGGVALSACYEHQKSPLISEGLILIFILPISLLVLAFHHYK